MKGVFIREDTLVRRLFANNVKSEMSKQGCLVLACTFDYLRRCYWLHCIIHVVVVVEVVSHSWECSKSFFAHLPATSYSWKCDRKKFRFIWYFVYEIVRCCRAVYTLFVQFSCAFTLLSREALFKVCTLCHKILTMMMMHTLLQSNKYTTSSPIFNVLLIRARSPAHPSVFDLQTTLGRRRVLWRLLLCFSSALQS